MLFSFIASFDLLFLVLVIHGDDTFDCTGYEDDSYHPIYDADDCRHYWHCLYVDTVYMHAVRRVCPSGTEFHATLRQCETSSLVDCVPAKSPHGPRTSSTTKAWKWRYSKLFSRKRWKSTMPSFFTTRKHHIFDLDQPVKIDTSTRIVPEERVDETTEKLQVLPFTLPQPTTVPFLEQLSKNFHAPSFHHRPVKNKLTANFFEPGEPNNEAELYMTTTRPKRRPRPTTQSTTAPMTTQMPFTTLSFTTEDSTSVATTTTTITTTTTASTMNFVTSTETETIQPQDTIRPIPQARVGGQLRRKNMTLYILTSEEHKIRQFSVNHTRGILINCNQLRRRLLGRRLRDILLTSTNQPLLDRNSARLLDRPGLDAVLFLTIFSLFLLDGRR